MKNKIERTTTLGWYSFARDIPFPHFTCFFPSFSSNVSHYFFSKQQQTYTSIKIKKQTWKHKVKWRKRSYTLSQKWNTTRGRILQGEATTKDAGAATDSRANEFWSSVVANDCVWMEMGRFVGNWFRCKFVSSYSCFPFHFFWFCFILQVCVVVIVLWFFGL